MQAAFDLARDRAGSSIAARMAIIAMTTSNSINVNAARARPPGPWAPGPMFGGVIQCRVRPSREWSGSQCFPFSPAGPGRAGKRVR